MDRCWWLEPSVRAVNWQCVSLSRTIAHFDLYGRVPLGDILQRQSVAEHLTCRPPVFTLTLLTTFDMMCVHERPEQYMRRLGWKV
jgi:hypothetical protein